MSCLDWEKKKAATNIGLCALLNITGIRFEVEISSEVFICQGEKWGGDKRSCWCLLLHSYIRLLATQSSLGKK